MKLKTLLILSLFFLMFIYSNTYAINLSSYSLTLSPGQSDSIAVYGGYHDNVINSIYALDGLDILFTPYYSYTSDNENDYIFSVKEDQNNIILGILKITVLEDTNINSAAVKIGNSYLKVQVDKLNDSIVSETKTQLLSEIKSNFVDITLKENVFEYTALVSDDLTKLDLKPIAINEKTKVDISTQIFDNMVDNKIVITATLDDETQEYIVNIVKTNTNKVVNYGQNNYHCSKIWYVILTVSISTFMIGMSSVIIKKRRSKLWKKSI